MAKKGALKSTLIVTSDELKVNGGRWLLQSGPAIRVRGFNSSSIGDRKVIGGDALPIYVLAETDARVNGGNFLLKGGQPIQVTDVIGTARGVIQGNAIPVWPVDDDGNFDPNFAGSYSQKVIDTSPIAYWILGEAAGAIAVDQIDSPAQDGAYTGVTLGQPGIGDGNTAPLFDGANDFVNIHSAALVAAFDGQEGTLAIWGRVSGVGVWADGISRTLIQLRVDGGNRIRIIKNIGVNQIRYDYSAAGVNEIITQAGVTTVDWWMGAITWSLSAGINGEVKAYFNGVQEGATSVALGVFVGNIINGRTNIGADNTAGPSNIFDGFAGHGIVWDRPLTQPELASLAIV